MNETVNVNVNGKGKGKWLDDGDCIEMSKSKYSRTIKSSFVKELILWIMKIHLRLNLIV